MAVHGKATPLAAVAVFCGSNTGHNEAYRQAADHLGRTLAERGIELVYGGGNVGLMGVVADAALTTGGRVVGVMPRHLVEREVAHRGLSELKVVADMHERKAAMAAGADAFIVLPGGPGTMEEFFEAWVWRLLGLHGKPIGLLNTEGYYDRLDAFLSQVVAEGFMAADARRALVVESDVDLLLDRL
ncbi:MAG: TIGR00730 family Rossman fold protein [Spirochaetaceae bacterium]